MDSNRGWVEGGNRGNRRGLGCVDEKRFGGPIASDTVGIEVKVRSNDQIDLPAVHAFII